MVLTLIRHWWLLQLQNPMACTSWTRMKAQAPTSRIPSHSLPNSLAAPSSELCSPMEALYLLFAKLKLTNLSGEQEKHFLIKRLNSTGLSTSKRNNYAKRSKRFGIDRQHLQREHRRRFLTRSDNEVRETTAYSISSTRDTVSGSSDTFVVARFTSLLENQNLRNSFDSKSDLSRDCDNADATELHRLRRVRLVADPL